MTLLGDIDKVSFWTGVNYQKKYIYDSYTTSLSVGNSWSHTETVYHNLGYRPNAKVWFEQDSNGRVHNPDPINSAKETQVRTKIYTDRIEITTSSPLLGNDVSLEVYYEIYLDADDSGEAKANYLSKYPIDRVYEIIEGSVTVGSGATSVTTESHTVGKPMLSKAIWSQDNTNWYSVRDHYDTSNPLLNAAGEFDVTSTDVNVYFANNLGASKTFYYKIALVEPEVEFPAGNPTYGLVLDARKDTFKNLESKEESQVLSGTIASGAIKTFTVTLSDVSGLNVSDFYYKESTSTFYYNGFVAAGTGIVSVNVTGGAVVTSIPVEIFLEVSSGQTKAIMWLYNPDVNTVTITSKTLDLRFIVYSSPFA